MGVLSVDEDVCIGLIQHSITDELLSNRNGLIHGHTKIRQIVQKSRKAKKSRSIHQSKNITQKMLHAINNVIECVLINLENV